MDKQDFEIEFQSEEEIEERMNAIVDAVGEKIMEDELKLSIIAPYRFRQMQFAYGVLKYITKGTGAAVTYQLHEPFQSTGSISVEAKELRFSNAEWFSRVAEFASNTEVYPLTNDKVRMSFGFNGLTHPVE